MKVIASISPVRVEADSRTFKQAASVARFGYTSVVVEGEPSDLEGFDPPFEVRTIRPRPTLSRRILKKLTGRGDSGAGETEGAGEGRGAKPAAVAAQSPRDAQSRGPLRSVAAFLKFLRFLRGYFYYDCVLPLRHIPRASLYYLHSPAYFPAVYLLSRWHGAPFIYDAHDFYTRMEEPGAHAGLEERLLRRFRRAVERLCVRKAAAVVTVSEGIAELQREAYGRAGLVMRNCQDARLDREPPADLRQSLGLSADEFLLVTVGQAKPGQAIREALDAMRLLPARVHLALLGRDYEQYLGDIRARGLDGRVHLVPPVKPYEVVRFIRTADASLMLYYPRSPNYVNCLPNGFFQSVAAERPLLYPELAEIKRLADRYAVGIPIDPQDPASIAAAVNELMADDERREAIRLSLRAAKQELSWEREEAVLFELISRVLGEEGSRQAATGGPRAEAGGLELTPRAGGK